MNNANGPQLQVYSHCLEISKKRGTRWTAFIDIDEFIVWKSEEKLKAIFRDFEEFSAVQLTWVHFASREERVEEGDGLVLETYTSREKSDLNKKSPRKSIVFAKNVSIMHVHHPELVPGSYCTDETRNMYSSCLQVGPVHTSVIYLHHYSTKSYNYFQCKALTPHAKRSGKPYRYGGKTPDEAIKKVKYIYLAQVNSIKRHAYEDKTILRHKKCLREHMTTHNGNCRKIKCWCKYCTFAI